MKWGDTITVCSQRPYEGTGISCLYESVGSSWDWPFPESCRGRSRRPLLPEDFRSRERGRSGRHPVAYPFPPAHEGGMSLDDRGEH